LIQSAIVPINSLISTLSTVPEIGTKIHACFTQMIDSLRDDLWCYLEFPYVDRIYRDAFYQYYSSKLEVYNRDCFRVSFFKKEIKPEQFFNVIGHEKLQECFAGFTVVRLLPNYQNPGRTAIAPSAFKNNTFLCELTLISANVGGVKLHVNAFPFSTQDGECMTCAETSIWAVMEYYGNKYPEHNIVLPSEIHKAFHHDLRVLPSNGLTVLQIASALTHFGFGTYLYARRRDPIGVEDPSDAKIFRRNLFYYIESGIPLILELQGKNVGHAVVAIGHENVSVTNLSAQISTRLLPSAANQIIDTADFARNIVIMDDNCPPYQTTEINAPCTYYKNSNYIIERFVVPLYHRIYLEAGKASEWLSQVVEDPVFGWKSLSAKKGFPVIKRIFLSTSGSYKSFVMLSDMDNRLKGAIQSLVLPKFVWLAELSTPDLFSMEKACGLVLLDATGSNTLQSIKMLLYPNYLRLSGKEYSIDFGAFDIYRNNLKGAF
jgi:hypothetical protein